VEGRRSRYEVSPIASIGDHASPGRCPAGWLGEHVEGQIFMAGMPIRTRIVDGYLQDSLSDTCEGMEDGEPSMSHRRETIPPL
jgi:hypothetical protein